MANILIPKRLVGIQLINLAARDPEAFAALSEKEYRDRVQAMAQAVLDSRCAVVMLAGPSASGKTTSANKLAEALTARGCPSQVLSLDDFYRDPETYPRLADGSKDYENVMALDIDCLHACLKQLVDTGECEAPQFDFLTEHRKDQTRRIRRDGGVVVVEGIHALNPLLSGNLSGKSVFRVYAGLREEYCGPDGRRILPTRDLRLIRRMVRDYKFRGHSPAKTLSLWDRVCEGESRYIRVFKQDAHYIMDTSHSYEPCLLAGQMLPLPEDERGTLTHDPRLRELYECIRRFTPLEMSLMPADSMLHEFFG